MLWWTLYPSWGGGLQWVLRMYRNQSEPKTLMNQVHHITPELNLDLVQTFMILRYPGHIDNKHFNTHYFSNQVLEVEPSSTFKHPTVNISESYHPMSSSFYIIT